MRRIKTNLFKINDKKYVDVPEVIKNRSFFALQLPTVNENDVDIIHSSILNIAQYLFTAMGIEIRFMRE